jgi:hypothetical protein
MTDDLLDPIIRLAARRLRVASVLTTLMGPRRTHCAQQCVVRQVVDRLLLLGHVRGGFWGVRARGSLRWPEPAAYNKFAEAEAHMHLGAARALAPESSPSSSRPATAKKKIEAAKVSAG